MKMNLSVVMQTVDKASAPLKEISGEYGHFTPRVNKAQKALKGTSDTLADVSSFKKSLKAHKENSDAIKVAEERLSKYQQQIKSGKALTAAQAAQYNKSKSKLIDLKQAQTAYKNALSKTGKSLKKSGVDTKNLTSEEKRLGGEYDKNKIKLLAIQKRYKALNTVVGKFKGIASKFSLGNITRGFGVITATSGVAIAGITSVASEADKLTKTAQNLKMPLNALQALQFQAEHAGVGADTMGSSMIRFTKRFGQLQSAGNGALGAYLKKSKDPLFGQLEKAKDTQQAYDQVLIAFSKLKSNQEQMAFADAAFGQDGRRMLLMLRDGTDGLTNARKEFNELGGGLDDDAAKAAEDYSDALFDIQTALNSIKFKVLAPVMKKLTLVFKDLITSFKNAKWREEAIKKVSETVDVLFLAVKGVFNVFKFLMNYFPEIIAGLALIKVGFFALNAAMMANPIGLVVAGLATLVIGIGYAYSKSETFRNILDKLWIGFKRFSAGIAGMVGRIAAMFLALPRLISKTLSAIPSKLLPKGWSDSIRETQKDLEGFHTKLVDLSNGGIDYAINGDVKKATQLVKGDIGLDLAGEHKQQASAQNNQPSAMLKNPQLQSRSTVDVRIKSDLPVAIDKVKTDGLTNMNVDTGGLLDFGY